MREELAVGLIETRGLVAAIEACDAALKAADVKLISIDRADAGLMTVKFVGHVAAVQAATDAGRMAATRVGTLFAAHIIPRPDLELYDELIYAEIRPRKKNSPVASKEPESDKHSDSENKDHRQTDPSSPTEPKPLNDMTVQELRRFARTLPNFPIQGRDISSAGRELLLSLIRQAQA